MIVVETSDRIFTLLDEKGIEQKKFATLVGTTDKTVSAWRTGRSKSYVKYISKIAEVLGTTTDYLTAGRGPIDWSRTMALSSLDSESRDLVIAYQQADERSRAMVRLALGLDDDTAIAARGGRVVKKPSPVSAETLDDLSRATEKEAKEENSHF